MSPWSTDDGSGGEQADPGRRPAALADENIVSEGNDVIIPSWLETAPAV
jgi:hypothetical protein